MWYMKIEGKLIMGGNQYFSIGIVWRCQKKNDMRVGEMTSNSVYMNSYLLSLLLSRKGLMLS